MKRYYQVTDIDEARDFFAENGYSLSYLLKINESDSLETGDVLELSKPEGRPYRVKPFETAESIAEKFGVSAKQILENNRIKSILPFSEIYIPEH